MTAKKVLIFGGAGRVGLGLAGALVRNGIAVSVADFVDATRLQQLVDRLSIDVRLSRIDSAEPAEAIAAYGGVDVLNETQITELLIRVKPDLVVNYAIPFTWDAARSLPNYSEISRAGLGAFAAVQVLAPKIIAQALSASGINAKFVVGNLPDITIPIIHGLSRQQSMALPLAGAGNVGLIEAAIRHVVALEQKISIGDIEVFLVAHHVHWVAPREPGYSNEAPFLLKVLCAGKDISEELGDLRKLMNRAITDCYEPGAGFSSTTALLAAQLVLGLLDTSSAQHSLHVPAANGLPGGFPVTVHNGSIVLNLPQEWSQAEAVALMQQAHQKDGIEKIAEDGSIHFNPESVAIMKKELGIELPQVLGAGDLEEVALEQIRIAQSAIMGNQSAIVGS